MSTQQNLNNSNKNFGIVFGIFFLLVFIYYFIKLGQYNIYFITLSIIFFILGFLNSRFLTPLNKLWIKFGELLGKVVSPIVMIMVYFFVVFPTKLILSLFKKDILDLKLDKNSSTYWRVRKKENTSMDNQF